MRKNVQVTFADGGTAVVAFRCQTPERIEIVIRAWALLYQRDVVGWERTSQPAEYWYDGRRKRIRRCDAPSYGACLEMLMPLAVAVELRKKAVEEMRKHGSTGSEIARQLSMPLSTVERMLQETAVKLPPQ